MCEQEIASDLMVLHRVDDPDRLPLWDWLRRVEFLPSYQGAVQARLRLEYNRAVDSGPVPVVDTPVSAVPTQVSDEDEERALLDRLRAKRYAGTKAAAEGFQRVSPAALLADAARPA